MLAAALALGQPACGWLVAATPAPGVAAVAPNPVAVALNGRTRRAFVLGRGALDGVDRPVGPGAVTVLDSDTGAALGTTGVGVDPAAVAVDEQAGRVFVVNRGPGAEPGSVSVLDARDGRLLQSIGVGIAPQAIALDAGAGRALVANRGMPPQRGSVTVIDAPRGAVLGEIDVGVYPAAVAVDPRRGLGFVANFVSNTVSILDVPTLRVAKTTRLGGEPGTVARLALDDRSGHLFALSYPPRVTGGGPTDGQVHVVDAESGDVLRSVALPNPTSLAVDARSGQVLVASAAGQEGRLTALDAESGMVLWTTPVGEEPDAVGVDELAERVFVLNRKSATMSVVQAKEGRSRCTLPVGEEPVAIAVDSQTHRALVISAKQHTGSVLRPTC